MGTAGQPILSAIKSEGLSDTVCVVVRYFGGIKLGSGGLIRAYGAAARLVLRDSPVEARAPKSTLKVRVSAEHIGSVYDVAARFEALVGHENYNPDGSMIATLTSDASVIEELRTTLSDVTRGSARLED
jgi:putative IMPACT (imprinted ancient) family translation regulator